MLGPRKRLAVEGLAQGLMRTEVAKLAGANRTTLWRWLKQEEFQRELARRQAESAQQVQEELFSRMAAAWTQLDALLGSVDASVRLRTTLWVLDRGLNVARQIAEQPSQNLADMALAHLRDQLVLETVMAEEGNNDDAYGSFSADH